MVRHPGAFLFCALLACASSSQPAATSAVTSAERPAALDEATLFELQQAFNAAASQTRILVLLSPT